MRIVATLVLLFGLALWGKMIDAVAVVVDGEPITTYEILNAAEKLGITKKAAIDLLVRQKLEEKQIKKLGIKVSESEVEKAIEEIARSKGMDLLSFQQALERQGIDWEGYKKAIKKQLLRKKLYAKIARTQTKMPSESEMKAYYESHPEEFTVAKKVEVTKYISPSKEVLARVAENPMAPQDPMVLTKGKEIIDLSKVNPQFASLLARTPEHSFTPILPLGDRYLLLYIDRKIGVEKIPFEEAKNYILNKLANKSGTKNVKEYFDKLKAAADIKVLRLP